MADPQEIRVDHPRHVLYQVATAMNGRHNDLSVTLPAHSAWKTAIQAAEEAMVVEVYEIWRLTWQKTMSTRE
ncbi:hypothetical protein MAP00_000131 [Monascus purpureus]|nr:hypothetical protein MAP00_000131 [Monascus purpureus]